jgi:hypothetical protein
MELTISLSIISFIVGFAISFFFFKKSTVKEIIKTIEVIKSTNQVQVAEIVTTDSEQFLKGFDYYNRKAVVSVNYPVGTLSMLKNGDILLYSKQADAAELILSSVSIG